MKFFAVLLLICFVSFTQSRDYTIEVNPEFPTNTIFVEKDSASSRYTGKVTYQGEGTEPCAWIFCFTRSFRGVVTEHILLDSDVIENTTRVLSETEGCLLVSDVTVNVTDEDGPTYGGSILTESFAWNAEGEFYMNGQLTQGNCSASLTVTGSECEDMGQFGFECEGVDAFPVPEGNVHLVPTELPSLVFAGLTSSYDGKQLGQLKMVMEVVDLDSDGMHPENDLGYVRLLLNGIPTENDYDFEVPLLAPQTELSIAAARRDSDYFYSVQATENVTVAVESISIMDCEYGQTNPPTYGPNCSITANTLTTDDKGKILTFDPTVDTFCYDDMCYFSLVQKNTEVTVVPVDDGDELAILYKTNNFPTPTDYDVAMPGSTSFIPDFLETETTANFVVYSPSSGSFQIRLGEGAPPPPPPPPPPSDDELPWAWIGVSIALGVIALALVTGFAIYTCKPARTYVTVE
eukprot:CAMPEP_0201516256 /NCGR_PEP_ID=MMETSP0161_2-20130828/7622_1 /ASSEMBLY_ACC=CAM_ASM_000251 /TAXON_ID=180227 /ORGANISM="Neoparamoeba aestuarina, Strain SoJaBio B1-5/56/2" /LENGTH=461 /DNA_ID=CAMNT_0047913323 /DNA_START=90 /DNA_END=1475 /DNA_ORIENTATION=+